jgi:hypothetical protein
MINFNIDAYGGTLRVNFGEDISSATAFTMEIQPQVGDKQSLTPTLGTSDVWVGDEKYLANQYVEYTITANQFKTGQDANGEEIGQVWRKKATATISSTDVRATQYSQFRVTV